jgi:type 1 glutamine amidotransferase
VLFLGGGSTSHNPDSFRVAIEPVLEKNNLAAVEYRTNESVLNADSLKNFDLMLLYSAKKGSGTGGDGTPNLTTAQENALYAWIEAGHAMVAVHCASSCYLANPRLHELIGADYTVHGEDLDHINIVKPTHAAMKGVSAPTGWDEGREHKFLKTDTVLLATNNSKGNPWTWIRPQGKGWVYYTSSGHDIRVWSDTKFQNQLVRAAVWGDSVTGGTVTAAPPVLAKPRGMIDLDGMRLHVGAPGRYELRIIDARGITVFSRNGIGSEGRELPALPAGAYQLGVSMEGEQRFVPLRVR